MLEACCLRHNKNFEAACTSLLALVLPISKYHQEDKVYFDEQGGKLKRLS